MRVLCTGFRLIAAGFGVIGRAVAAADCVARGGQRLFGNAQRVGTHVSDQADRALTGDLHALVKLLCDHHRAARGHVELARRLLLERRGDKGRRGGALFLRFLHAGHGKRLALQRVQNGLHILLTRQLALLRVAVVVRGEAAGLAGAVQIYIQRPVFLRDKGPDLVLAVDDQTGRDRLHASGGQALADLFPEQGAELIADNAVEHAARLLRVDEILVDGTRVLDGFLHDVACDLVEGHAVCLVIRNVQQIFQMPRDGFALAVRVSREIDAAGALRGLAQVCDDVFLSLERLVLRLKIVLDIDAQRALRQIAQMAHAGLDLIVGAKIFSDGFGLRGRLHDDQILFCVRHRRLHVIFSPAHNTGPAAA
ncbi:flagellar basal body rod protein [Firmicutes bacterium CAG:124]|nr:flagellar basal body rod protein [Firmicutes bacterium CAG:124]